MESTGTSVAQQRNRIPTSCPLGMHQDRGAQLFMCHWALWHNDTVPLRMTVMVQGEGGSLSEALPKAC